MPLLLPLLFLVMGQAPEPGEIHVDHLCRIYARDRGKDGHWKRASLHSDPVVCHLESVHHSHHYDEVVDQGTVKRTRVEIREQMYIFTNVTPETVAFVVDHPVPKGWRIDSDPAPALVAEELATFRVVARPGETVRLHVGERR